MKYEIPWFLSGEAKDGKIMLTAYDEHHSIAREITPEQAIEFAGWLQAQAFWANHIKETTNDS